MEAQDNQVETDDIDAAIASAIDELEGNAPEEQIEAPESEDPAESAQVDDVEGGAPEPQDAEEAPSDSPHTWGKAAKEKWGDLPKEVRDEITKRENDIHKALTRHDGELRLGRDMKEIIAPYMPIIQAEGGTPASTVQAMLNAAYILRAGSAEQKRQFILNTAKQYGVELGDVGEDEYTDPTISALQQEIQQLKAMADPNSIKKLLTEEAQNSKINAEIEAFASDPANEHFTAVQPIMVSLLQSNAASGLKEAYDMACNAHPQIRSTLEAKRLAEDKAKRQAELKQKKHAAASVTGSPAISNSSARKSQNTTGYSSPEDDIRAAIAELESRV